MNKRWFMAEVNVAREGEEPRFKIIGPLDFESEHETLDEAADRLSLDGEDVFAVWLES